MDCDIVIAGGGLVGASLAAALANTELRVVVVEAVPLTSDAQPSYDERMVALTWPSRRIFEGIGIWATGTSSERLCDPVNPCLQSRSLRHDPPVRE